MYKDDIWYRDFSRAVGAHKEAFSEKQNKQFQIEAVLRLALRVRDFSDKCEICRGYQHTLTRLEEEMPELPGSQAQRQYQNKQVHEMQAHFVKVHHLSPPGYYMRKWIRYGLLIGFVLGFAATTFTGNTLYFPAGCVVGILGGALYGNSEDAIIKNQRRSI
ncbi:MAG: hypothetical protein JXA33_02855 [Anaerolineae bacterium]|nr:hypothetical protein [Anaerolineae bacterium]